MLNAAINTSALSLSWLDWEECQYARLKERDVKHVRISSSSSLLKTYAYGTKIGQGSFATVLSIRDKDTNKEWAMKIINKNMVGNKIQSLQREIQILKMVNHPHIIYLDKVYESPRKLYLILERCYGALSKIFEESKPFSELDTKKVIKDIVSAVSYLHKHDIVHRDLKLQNILITQNPKDKKDKLYIKLSDFGLSIVKHGSSIEHMLHEYCGTHVYMAPEILTSNSYSQQCDIWSIGVIMYLLLSGEFPFYTYDEKDLTSVICNKEPRYNNMVASNAAIHLLSKMLVKNPALRITAAEIEMHPWICGKPMMNRRTSPDNVLDMMKLWRSDMRLPVVEECDWVSSANAVESALQLNIIRGSRLNMKEENQLPKQSIALPKQNIRFDKKRIENMDNACSSKSEKNSTSSSLVQTKFKKKVNLNAASCKYNHERHIYDSAIKNYTHIPRNVDTSQASLQKRSKERGKKNRSTTSTT